MTPTDIYRGDVDDYRPVFSTDDFESAPAYDCGYLLRKLRPFMYNGLGISARDAEFEFILQRPEGEIFLQSDTLENNACKLAIELFKQGILVSEPKPSTEGVSDE